VALSLVAPVRSKAAECAHITMPETMTVDGVPLTLNGLGLRLATLFNVKVYVAALYVPHPDTNADALLAAPGPMVIELNNIRDVRLNDIRNALDEGFTRTTGAKRPLYEERIRHFESVLVDLHKGDRLSFIRHASGSVDLSLNGSVRGTVAGADFARALFAIWLGDPPNLELKAGLLGGSCG
jgi:hypothetical protein